MSTLSTSSSPSRGGGATSAAAPTSTVNSFTSTSTVNSIVPGVILPPPSTTVSIASSKSILTGSCTVPNFALVTEGPGGGFLEYPLIGCSNLFTECCPFDVRKGALLSACPADYTTTGTGCCPSGFSVYSTQLGGATPCYTTPALPLVPPGVTTNPAVSVINTQLFALQYTLAPRSPSPGVSGGAIAGAVIGSLILLALVLLGTFLILRRYRRRRAISTTASHPEGSGEGEYPYTLKTVPYAPTTPSPTTQTQPSVSELPSPHSTFLHMPMRLSLPRQELEGDTYIHAHHPAHRFTAAAGVDEHDGNDRDSEGFKEAAAAGLEGIVKVRSELEGSPSPKLGSSSPLPADLPTVKSRDAEVEVGRDDGKIGAEGSESPVLGRRRT